MKLTDRISRYFLHHIRFAPIRVFCLHHIADVHDPNICNKSDWISTSHFKAMINHLLESYTFISLSEAHEKLKHDLFRRKSYAVLTFDDGYLSPLSSLHWLEDKGIPYTLFLNAKYLDGKTISPHILRRVEDSIPSRAKNDISTKLYLTEEDLYKLSQVHSSFGSHGFEHLDASQMSTEVFVSQIEMNLQVLTQYKQYIPFHAYTWGRHTTETDMLLNNKGLIPVLIDGEKNYNDSNCIHRELFPDFVDHY